MNDRTDSMAETFGAIYSEGRWGRADGLFCSGSGSHTASIFAPYVEAVRQFISRFEAPPSVVDLGCGDFNVGSQIADACKSYVACDVVPALIAHNREAFAASSVRFEVHDLTRDRPPTCDIIFIRQVLQHLSNEDIHAGLERLQGRCRYLVVTEHIPAHDFMPNLDKPSGASIRLDFGSGVVLTAEPFNLSVVEVEVLCEVPEYAGVVRTIAYTMPATNGQAP